MGALGNGTQTAAQASPVYVSGLKNVVSLAGTAAGFQALRADGTVWCWGYSPDAECATAPLTVTKPVQIPTIEGAVALGPDCAVLGNGTLWCWGDNRFGELGIGTASADLHTIPVRVPGLTDVVAVAGDYYRCALRADGTVWCWGETLSFTPQPKPAQMSGLSNIVAITGSDLTKCALRNDATIWCWGRNTLGELGNGNGVDSATPVQVTGIGNAVAVAVTAPIEFGVPSEWDSTSCAILLDGTVRCWGANVYGALGNGTSSNGPQPTPVVASGVSDALQIALGGNSTYALTASGTLWSWGANASDQLGIVTTSSSQLTPIQVPIAP
jgi:alpha-tubulin suppressor-like RCC1 family protein